MSELGYKGMSFPFRVGVKGGVNVSTTDSREVPHLQESIRQILGTSRFERVMEVDTYADLDAEIFEPNDESTKTLIEYQIRDALLRNEPRIEIQNIDITGEENIVYATIKFRALAYNSSYTMRVKVGETNVYTANT